MNLLEQEAQPSLSYRTIPLTQGQVALVDECDYERLIKHKWHAIKDPRTGKYYAVRYHKVAKWKYRHIRMNRDILGLIGKAQGDHEDGDTLNNRRYNLRSASASQNGSNRGPNRNNKSGYKGVRWRDDKGKFVAYINVNRKYHHLGYFTTAEDAHEAYKMAAPKLHGEFARF